ncbi:oligopeptide transport system substrate-binding protein [Peptoclostridium litorale DSM 5388]|uniref:Oligopeptide-binding protein OppA n=1 Tax=Peptoclostridium litorale DSM 5388 TaxID=1121324 RepID=A0A069RND0_PEPLI|nr:peptide ABC transporter substrate-binding protein [Peptoclostridium litorale]KDR95682.1 oligopeptide-binding protein OppA [Peptoclostridium litorale DSM 5388]SIO00987.1 oligopeptide transport system substrate-binding protein [Peptoclostridium litorale DSM 5388]
MKKLVSILLSAMLVMTALVGCGDKGDTKELRNVVRYNLEADVKTIDPALNAAVDGAIVTVNAFEGLMRLDDNDKAIAGVAESFDVSEDGTVYTFHLRDSKWSDGEALTAKDFEYAWKRALSKEAAAEYAYQLYYLKNGEAYNKGEVAADEVGVKAIDDKTLEVTLESSVPYFLELTAFPTYFPVRQDMVEAHGEQWALKPESYITNGPFKLEKWEKGNIMAFVKNENYYDADRIKLDGIEFSFMEEISTAMASFESGDVDALHRVAREQIPTFQAENNPEFKIFPQIGTYFYAFNVNVEPTNDLKVRQAFTLAIDREAITKVVTKGGETPATGFVPTGMTQPDGKDFREAGGDYGITTTAQVEKAQALLAEAGYPNGEGFPKIKFVYNTNENHKKVAEAISEMWKQNLGVEVELVNQEWQVFQNTRNEGDFVIARDGWVGDYVDPMTFIDMFISTSGNNHPHWNSEEFDNIVREAKLTSDETKRFEMMHKAEDMIMADMIVMPVYYYTNPKMFKEYVKGARVSPLGFVYFDNAYIEQ